MKHNQIHFFLNGLERRELCWNGNDSPMPFNRIRTSWLVLILAYISP